MRPRRALALILLLLAAPGCASGSSLLAGEPGEDGTSPPPVQGADGGAPDQLGSDPDQTTPPPPPPPPGPDGGATLDGLTPAGCAAQGGRMLGKACWFLTSDGLSCKTTCAKRQLAYDDATLTFAGSSGSTNHCKQVLDALNMPGTLVMSGPTPSMTGLGCHFNIMLGRYRDIGLATSAIAAFPSVLRVCACRKS